MLTTAKAARAVKEAPVGVWLWAVLVLEIVATVVIMDVWLYKNNYEMLTTEFKEGLRNPVWGPIIVFISAGTVAGLVWHFWNTRDGSVPGAN